MKKTLTILTAIFLSLGAFAQNQVVFDIRVDSVSETNEAYFRLISYVPDTAQRQVTYKALPNNIRALTEQIKSWRQTKMDYIVQIKDTSYSETFREGLEQKRDQLNVEIEKYKLERQFRRAVRDSIKSYLN